MLLSWSSSYCVFDIANPLMILLILCIFMLSLVPLWSLWSSLCNPLLDVSDFVVSN